MPTSVQISLPLDLRPYNNRRLFADHFLHDLQRLRAMADWQQAEGMEEAFQRISQLYTQRAVHFNNHTNEAQTEHDFIRPVLDLLWDPACYQVQVRIPNVDVQQQPDYAFFRAADARQAAQPRHGTLDYWRDVPCLGDAKRWTASLDKERGVTGNPSNQISNYLYRSGVRWGILTNGRLWRLYEREKSRAGGIYYEVDLEHLLQRGNLDALKHFYLFFRRDAFLPDSSGVTFVEKVFQGSIDYASEVGDKLKESVYDALCHLMNGFLAYPENGLDAHNADTVRQVHEHCLIVLYRLLFILYAEDRNLLPRDDDPYASYSLAHLHRQINQQLREHHAYLPNMTGLWHHVLNLFQLIDTGFPEGGIPAYNGGLFSPARYPHIAHTPQRKVNPWQLDDRHCAAVIDLLAYARDRWDEAGVRDVDYATLAVQHLGSIYEGLLELQPRIADEAMVEITEDGKPVFKPVRAVPNPRPIRGQPPRTMNAGDIYLVTNRGERKATGSYYTPKYIVDYIVEQTVGALADEAAKRVAELRPDVESEIHTLERTRQTWEGFATQKSSTERALHESEQHTADLSSLIERQKRHLLEPYLSLKILDPAMGSGHFLVGAADHLSMAMATDPNLLPLEDMDDEDPQMFYKRLVVERCLYGVDLNPLAVELAKLSLWLHTVSKDKALSFLDHHLRCGNSLIGVRVEDDLMKEPPRFNARGKLVNSDSQQLVIGFSSALTATHLHHFLDTFRTIMEMPSGDAAMERKKDQLYRDMDTARDKYRAVANGWLAPFFGIPVTSEQYECAVNTLRGTDAEWHALMQEAWFAHAQQVARDKRFFHWELEFPEIFFDATGLKPHEERGFDAVIGNPPYGATIDLTDKPYIRTFFTTSTYNWDSFSHFVENTVQRLSKSRASMIIPNTWLTTDDGRPLRQLLLNNGHIETILDTGNVFEAAIVDTIVLVFNKTVSSTIDERVICIQRANVGNTPNDRLQDIAKRIWQKCYTVPQNQFLHNPNQAIDIFVAPEERDLIQKARHISTELSSICKVARGARPYGLGEGTLPQSQDLIVEKRFHASFKVDSTFYPLLTASEVHRYQDELHSQWLSWGPWLAVQGEWQFFSQERILLQRVVGLRPPRFIATLLTGTKLNNTDVLNIIAHDVAYSLHFVLSVLNSRLLLWYAQKTNVNLERAAFPKINVQDAANLPIRRITFTTPPDERARLVEEGKKLYHHIIKGMEEPR